MVCFYFLLFALYYQLWIVGADGSFIYTHTIQSVTNVSIQKQASLLGNVIWNEV